MDPNPSKPFGGMDPNSQHQMWSSWKFEVVPGLVMSRPFREVKYNIARFFRKAFGTGSQLNVQYDGKKFLIRVQTEGHPAHDPHFVKYYEESFRKFFVEGFGLGTRMTMVVNVKAGDKQDGKPREQWIVLPMIDLRQGV